MEFFIGDFRISRRSGSWVVSQKLFTEHNHYNTLEGALRNLAERHMATLSKGLDLSDSEDIEKVIAEIEFLKSEIKRLVKEAEVSIVSGQIVDAKLTIGEQDG